MTNVEYDKIINDDKWVKIYFMTHCGQGHLLIKNSLYEKRIRKIEKSLRGLISSIDYDYHLTLDEVLGFDTELEDLKRRGRHFKSQIEWYMAHNRPEEAKEYLKLNGENNQFIEDRIEAIKKEYEEKGGKDC